MKYISFLFYLLFSIILISCKSDDIVNTNPVGTIFDIPIYQYNENSYLLDTSYGRSFESFHLNGTSGIQINRVEVWVYCEPDDPLKRHAFGFRDILPRPDSGYAIGLFNDSDGVRRSGNFRKLYSSEYNFYQYAGYITIKNFPAISPKDAIFAAYSVTVNGLTTQYGDFVDDIPSGSILTLKMLRDRSEKSPRENTAYTQLWSLMMKNIYSIGVKNLINNPDKLANVRVVKSFGSAGDRDSYGANYQNEWVNGKSYMYLTGIDRKSNGNPGDTVRGGDGQFDFFPGATIDLESGSIIFPTLKPFSTYMMGKGVPADSLGFNDSIYYNSRSALASGNFVFLFTIKGEVKN